MPLVPPGATDINDRVSVVRDDGHWTYFFGILPVFRHAEEDQASFRMFTAQLVEQGVCRPVEVVRTFGVPKTSVFRSVKKYREGGVKAFYQRRRGRGPAVMTAEVTAEAQQLLHEGMSRRAVAAALGIGYDTLRKAIGRSALSEPSRPTADSGAQSSQTSSERARDSEPGGIDVASNKSQRSSEDASAEMGTACTRPGDRVLAALGMLEGAPTRFEACHDVSLGGVLCALPALVQNGLFRHLSHLALLKGYYTTVHVLLLLAYMALCRIKTVERLQYESPGELGKLLGLDRVPEVRCLREKLKLLSQDNAAEQWAGALSRDWMEAEPELAGTFYIDGHVRLYHGKQAELPRRYVSRQRLCLRGTTDYWVNDALGRPFFVVDRPVDHGLLEVLRTDVVPRLLRDVPSQPDEEQLKADPHLCRLLLVFDREGYSPVFFNEMWQDHRIACITYHKYPKGEWPKEEFVDTCVRLPSGETVSLKLAERGSWIGSKKDGLWVREIRKLSRSDHQTSLISTAYAQLALQDAAWLFSRWSQENFFRYMMQHFSIDLLSEYGTEELPGTSKPVVNPPWRELDRQSRSLKAQLTQRQARFGAWVLHPEADVERVSKWELRKAEMVEEIEQIEHRFTEIQQQLKQIPKHVEWEDLPEKDRFQRLAPSRKRLIDTVKMIAYRAETALTSVVRESLKRTDDARSLLQDLFCSEADLLPDLQRGVLHVHVHSMANPRTDRAVHHLLEHLNDTEFTYPGTQLKLVYTLVGKATKPS